MAPRDVSAELDEIVVELYALAPAEFTAGRTRRARAEQGELSAAIRGIPKPVVAAWAVDLMAREGLLGDAMALAAQLRDAQADADAAEMTRLGRQRRQLVAALAQQGAELAAERGVAVSAPARAGIEQTLNAAMIDAGAAAAVLSARLVRPIEATGLGDAAVGDAVTGSPVVAAEPGTSEPNDDLADRRARKAAERAAREAEQAERESTRVQAQRDRARERLTALHERIDQLRRDLGAAEAQATEDEAEQERLDHAADAANQAAMTARRRATTLSDSA